jgi:hypothetical protein
MLQSLMIKVPGLKCFQTYRHSYRDKYCDGRIQHAFLALLLVLGLWTVIPCVSNYTAIAKLLQLDPLPSEVKLMLAAPRCGAPS